MDFIDTSSSTVGLTLLSLAGIVVSVAVLLFCANGLDKLGAEPSAKRNYLFLGMSLSFAMGVISFVSAINFWFVEPIHNRIVAAQTAIEESYDLKLSTDEVEALEYPSERPTSDFESFGSIDKTTLADDDSILKREISLVWKDGKMILAQSKNGEDFEPLELQN